MESKGGVRCGGCGEVFGGVILTSLEWAPVDGLGGGGVCSPDGGVPVCNRWLGEGVTVSKW